jgi:RHS repeat-associated protein
LWASHTQAKQIIPQSQLTPDSPTPTPSFTATQTFTATITDTAVPPTNTPTATQIAHSGQIWKTYYYAGAQRVAMRVQGDPNPSANGVFYTLGDHLGSTSLVTDASGSKISEMRYKPWGETRYANGIDLTSYKYTGQREESGIGLYYYNARWYDPEIAHFIQSDTIISSPARPSSWDNYAYVNNNSINNIDPSGHCTGTYNDSDPCWAKYRELSAKNPKLVLRDMNRIDEDRLEGLLQWSERGVIFEGNFGYWEVVNSLNGLNFAQKYFGDKTDAALRLDHGSLTIRWGLDDAYLISENAGGVPDVLTNKVLMLTGHNTITNFLHELCHIIDYNMGGTNYWSLSNYLTGQYIHFYYYWEGVKGFDYWLFLGYPGSTAAFTKKNPIEDFADSLMIMILKDQIGIPDSYDVPDQRRQDDIEKGKNSL